MAAVTDRETSLLNGWGEWLAGQGLAVWDAEGVYPRGTLGGLPAVTIGAVPQDPDTLVTLTLYGLGPDPIVADSTVGLQVRARCAGSDPRPVADLAGGLFAVMHGRQHLVIGGVHVAQVVRTSWATLGQDSAGRWSRTDNYAVTIHNPTAYRT